MIGTRVGQTCVSALATGTQGSRAHTPVRPYGKPAPEMALFSKKFALACPLLVSFDPAVSNKDRPVCLVTYLRIVGYQHKCDFPIMI